MPTTTAPTHTAAWAEAELAALGVAGAAAAIRRGDLTSEAYTAALPQRELLDLARRIESVWGGQLS